jgi:hypothetical protein
VAFDREKLSAATALVKKQVNVGHVEPNYSIWNILILGIRKMLGRGPRWKLKGGNRQHELHKSKIFL